MNVEAPNRGCDGRHRHAYTLMELICTIAIIGLMAALLLPTVSKGFARARRIYCINSLRNMGLAFHGFAHGHEDKFPIQVSTNAGGSLEWLQASAALSDEFYFSYRHFTPLSNDLPSAKIFACPADSRQPTNNYADFRNENLSYFAASNPEFGKADSILAGDRNLTPTFGSVARIGGVLYLKWTGEMHQYKGNVLFADGHVEQMNAVLRLTNSTSSKVETLLVPSLQRPSNPTATGVPIPGGAAVAGGAPAGGKPSSTRFMLTNQWVAATNPIQITTSSRRKPINPGGAASSSQGRLATDGSIAANQASGSRAPEAEEEPATVGRTFPEMSPRKPTQPPPEPEETNANPVAAAQRAAGAMVAVVYAIPWYLILLLLLAMVELRRRLRQHQKRLRGRPDSGTAFDSLTHQR